MKPGRWQELKRLIESAVKLPPAEQAAFIAKSCGGDESLKRDLESMLEINPPTGFLESPAIEIAAREFEMELQLKPRPSLVGNSLLHYHITEKLGEGGMGIVYRAHDSHLDRSVAIKVLPAESTADPVRRQRFVHEAKAASALNHPNIVHIYDITTDRGVDFIAMECVEGLTLQQRIDLKNLRLNDALKYAVQIADALAKAHSAGIVHRDLKPSNIMVNDDGIVKVLDFGLAKLMEPAEGGGSATTATAQIVTGKGAIVGTITYMSPEQAEGRPVDVRSDIFSFGSVLYEMVTGQPAFQGKSKIATLSNILTKEPVPVSQAAEGVPQELERIIARCLRKDPARRFQTAADLKVALEDVRDDSDPFRPARPTGVAAGKVTTLRWAVAVASVLMVGAAVWLLGPGRSAGPQAPREKHVVVLPFDNIGNDPANASTCDGLLETLTSRLTSLEHPGGPLWVVPASEVRKANVTDASAAEHALGANLVVTGSVQRDASGVRLTVNLVDTSTPTPRQIGSSVIDDRQGNFSALQDNVVATLAGLLNVELSPRALGNSTGESAAAPAAYEYYLQGLSRLQRYDKTGNLDAAVNLFKSAIKDDPRFALAYARLGEALWTKDRVSPDPQLVEQALANCRRAEEINGQLAPVHVILGRIHAGTGKYDLAIQEFQRALELDPRSAEAYQQMARAYESMGRASEAEANLKKAVSLRSDNWDEYNSLGAFYARQSRYPEAAEAFHRVLDLTPDNAAACSNLGVVLNRMGDRAGARRMYEKSIGLNPSYSAYTNLAGLYYQDRDYARAAATYEKALKLNDRDYRTWGGLASAYAGAGMPDKARAANERALKIAEVDAAKDPNNADIQSRVAWMCAGLGMRDEALRRIESALVLAPADGNVLYRAALVYEVLGDRQAALKYLKAALARGYSKDWVKRDPDLEKLREAPEFQVMIK